MGRSQFLISPLDNRGLVALARQEYRAAQTAFEEILAVNSALAAERLNLGMLMLTRGEPARARPYMPDVAGG
jgi:hypothetical protein